MKELIEYLERKIELCTEMNMPLEKFAYTDALKKARALQLQQTGVSGSVLQGVDLVKECANLIVETQNGSVSLLQRRLNLSYNKASRIMDVLEEIKIVDQFSGEKKREVFIKNLEDLIPKLDEINVYNCRFV